ncbi:hypothetical protein [Duganella sacchari]|uniref:hypothetical protein n=1 Tax=Duganella sacchari TaxID=551987 RepID=UPI00111505E1|nr:hypothetical protein [Duganella sacchari]
MLSQVQDDRIWKDIKCFKEIYEKFFKGGAKTAVYRHLRPVCIRRLWADCRAGARIRTVCQKKNSAVEGRAVVKVLLFYIFG